MEYFLHINRVHWILFLQAFLRMYRIRRYWLKDILNVDLRLNFLQFLIKALRKACEWHWAHRAGSWATGDLVMMRVYFQALSDCIGWKSSVEAQEHSVTRTMSVQRIIEKRSMQTSQQGSLHMCGSCNVTKPNICKEQWRFVCDWQSNIVGVWSAMQIFCLKSLNILCFF